MKLKDLMTGNPAFVSPETSLQEAADKMREHDIGVLPVCDGSTLVGVITDRDLAVRAVAQGKDPRADRVADSMTRDLAVCYDDQDAAEGEQMMEERKVRRLLVLDREQHLVGVVSLGDFATKSDERCGVAHTLEAVSQDTK
jgi:CBS domain-containing protein